MKIETSIQLKERIRFMEAETQFKKQLLVNQFNETYESLKPANLLKSSIDNFIQKPGIINKVVRTALNTRNILKGGANLIKNKVSNMLFRKKRAF